MQRGAEIPAETIEGAPTRRADISVNIFQILKSLQISFKELSWRYDSCLFL